MLIKAVKVREFHLIFLEPSVAELYILMYATCRFTAIYPDQIIILAGIFVSWPYGKLF